MAKRVGPDRIWTVPNVLSIVRLLLLAIFVVVLFTAQNRYVAFAVLVVAGVTDFLDGFTARHFNQVTEIGKLLDPIVDRIAIATAIIAVAIYGAVPAWFATLVLVREALIFIAGVGLSLRGMPRIDVLPVGKVGTFGLMFAFPMFIVADGPGSFASGVHVAAWVIAIPSLCASWAAAFAYVPIVRRQVTNGHSTIGSSTQ